MSESPRLALQDLDISFGREVGLRALSLEVAKGETVALVGSSGAGKSSLLRAVAGLDAVGGGTIRIDRMDVTRTPAEQRGAVYLHQTPLLFPHLSVEENVAFPLRIRRQNPALIRQRVTAVLDALGMASFRTRAPHALSGGQRHRVALARAIAGRPPVLLLDEPLTGLDPGLREEALAAIRLAAAEYDPATLYVTHDLSEAGAIADRIGVLLDGALRQVATPEVLFTRPASAGIARFVGFTNHLEGSTDGSTFTSKGWTIPMQTEVRGPAVLLFRPQALRVAADGDLEGFVTAVAHAPTETRLKVRIGGTELDAVSGSGSNQAAVGEARLHLDRSGTLLFPA